MPRKPDEMPEWLADYERNWIDGSDTAEIWQRFNAELDERLGNATAYIDRILSHNPNGAELMFLVTVKQILQGMDDGLTANETEDKSDG